MSFRVSSNISPIAAGVVFLMAIIRVIYLHLSSDATLIGVIPDDAFYYLQMAKHRVVDGFWTFDGTAVATGFHFLYGYFLACLYAVFGDIGWRNLFLLVSMCASVSIGMAAYFTFLTVERLFDRRALLIAVVPFLTSTTMIQTTAMMESWLVLLFTSLTVYVLAKTTPLTLLAAVGSVAIGLLGSLSRTDYGLLPGVVFCAAVVSSRSSRSIFVRRSLLLLVGAVIGVGVVLCQNYVLSGHLTQASAQVKLHWSAVAGHSLTPSVRLIASTVLPFWNSMDRGLQKAALLGAFALVAWGLLSAYRSGNASGSSAARPLFIGCLVTLLGYLVFYRYNSEGLQLWYAANVIVPMAMVLTAALHYVLRERLLIPAGVVAALYVCFGAVSLFTVTWPHQAGMMQAGRYVKADSSEAVYASWNAGIIGYFSGKAVVNLDGVTNDEVLPFIEENALWDYIKARKITHLIDYEAMVTDRLRRVRGGYEDPRTDACLRCLRAVDDGCAGWRNSRLVVLEIDPTCR